MWYDDKSPVSRKWIKNGQEWAEQAKVNEMLWARNKSNSTSFPKYIRVNVVSKEGGMGVE